MGDFLRKMLTQQRNSEDPNYRINALVYLRVSTGRQAAKEFSSIDAQRKMVAEYASQNPRIRIVGEYSDAKSAKDINRDGFRAMLERIKLRGIDAVISYKNDRICRNSANFAILKNFLSEHNVRLLYSNDLASDGSPTGDFVEDITVNLSEMERKKISERTAHKYLQNLKRGYRSGGVAPLGYKIGDKPCLIVIDEPNAEIIRKIFAKYLGGTKPSQIVNLLNAEYGKIPERTTRSGRALGGKPFHENFVRKVLTCPTYAGYNYISLGEENGIPNFDLYKGTHEAIVSKEDWDMVRNTLFATPKERKITPVIASDKYFLKGYLYCLCGSLMTAATARRGEREHRYYICSRKNKEHSACDCTTGNCSAEVLESIVFSALGYFFKHKIKATSSDTDYESNLQKRCSSKRSAKNRLEEKMKSITDELIDCSDELIKEHLRQ